MVVPRADTQPARSQLLHKGRIVALLFAKASCDT